MPVVSLDDVRKALNQVSGVNDIEILGRIVAAEAEYEDYVGPLSAGPLTETYATQGGPVRLRSSRALAITAMTFRSGRIATLTSFLLQPRTGVVEGPFGTDAVTITYTLSPLSANHYDTIVADVAGYFEATQRGGQGGALPEDGFGAAFSTAGTPMTLYPRVRALKGPRGG